MATNGLNKVMVIGNLAKDAELVEVGENATPRASFRVLATTPKGRDAEHTEGFNCVLWGKRADALARYLTRGKRVYVEGELRTRFYETETGEKRYFTDLNVREIIFQPQVRRDGADAPPVEQDEEILF